MDKATQVQILDEAICISHSANTLGKGVNSTILPLAIDQTEFFNLGMTTSQREGKLCIQTC